MDTRFRAYVKAFGHSWGTQLSGIASVPFTVAALFVDASWQRGIFGAIAVGCFLYSSYELWRNERKARNANREELQSIQNHRHLRDEWQRLEENFARFPQHLEGLWEQHADGSSELKWTITGLRDQKDRREAERLSIVMEEAGNLLSTSNFFSANFPRVVTMPDAQERWLTAVCAMAGNEMEEGGRATYDGFEWICGSLPRVAQECAITCAKLAAQEGAAQIRLS
jgi:hypothetical protein